MSKRTRMKYQVANQLGTALTKAADYTLTENNILEDGNQHIILSAIATLTLPAASINLNGIIVRVTVQDQGSVYVSGGFGGGGASYDTADIGKYETTDFWCNGTYWYALSQLVNASASSSSSSSSSSSFSSSSSSSG